MYKGNGERHDRTYNIYMFTSTERFLYCVVVYARLLIRKRLFAIFAVNIKSFPGTRKDLRTEVFWREMKILSISHCSAPRESVVDFTMEAEKMLDFQFFLLVSTLIARASIICEILSVSRI